LTEILKPLQDYQKSLSGEGSGVTAIERLRAAEIDYEKAKADFRSGKIDQSELTFSGQNVFSLAREIFGTATGEFQSIRQRLIGDASDFLETARSTFDTGAPQRLQAAVDQSNVIMAQQYQQLTQINIRMSELIKAVNNGFSAANGSGIQFLNGRAVGFR
jgi:hypothetical protein